MTLRFAPLRIAAMLVMLSAVALAACGDGAMAPAAGDEGAPSVGSATEVATSAAPIETAPIEPAPGRRSLTPAPASANSTTAGTVAVVGCAGTSVSLSADEKRTLDLHNQTRAANALAPFCVHPALTAAARAHAQDMLAKGYFSHTSLDGRTFVTRVTGAGYTSWRALAENIAWGSGTNGAPDAIVRGWMNSAGHKANILNGSLREIGIGVAAGTFRTYANARVYAVDFGTRW